MAKYIVINSQQHLQSVLSQNKYVFIDFWATWCPPCKMIAPIFEQLASANTREGKFVFAKVDVDEQNAIAQEYGITAMPTFVLVKDGKAIQSIRGANPPAIKALVTSTSQDVEKLETAEKKAQEAEKNEGEETTVSGDYSMTSNSNWRMAL
jgi:thioredoxin 1